jgi:hypothetical protein
MSPVSGLSHQRNRQCRPSREETDALESQDLLGRPLLVPLPLDIRDGEKLSFRLGHSGGGPGLDQWELSDGGLADIW